MKLAKVLAMAVLVLSSASLSSAIAADYPGKDITHIIPWGAGGGTDTAMRRFMHHAEKQLGVGINSQNIKGAQSGVGTLQLMNSRPDGYTVGTLTWDSAITVPYYGLVPGYDTSRLTFLGTVTNHATTLVVRADSPWQSISDMVAAAKENPGEFTVSNVGTGGVWHLPALDIADKAGIDIRHVPYPDGAGSQREALLSGETDMAVISLASVLPSAKAGKVRVLGIMANQRSPSAPGVPTFKEAGYDVIWGSFRVIAIPAGAPQPAKGTLEAAFAATFEDQEFVKAAEESGMGATWMNGADTAAFIGNMQKKAFAMIDDLIARGLLEKKNN